MLELSESWQVGLLTASQAEKDLVDDAVQTVRGLSLGHTGPAGHPFCDIRLLHSGFTVAVELVKTGVRKPVRERIVMKISDFGTRKKSKIVFSRGIDELILIRD